MQVLDLVMIVSWLSDTVLEPPPSVRLNRLRLHTGSNIPSLTRVRKLVQPNQYLIFTSSALSSNTEA